MSIRILSSKSLLLFPIIFSLFLSSCDNNSYEINYNYLSHIARNMFLEILIPVEKDGKDIEIFFENNIFFFEYYCKTTMTDDQYDKFTKEYFLIDSKVDSNNAQVKKRYINYIQRLYSRKEKITYNQIKELPHVIVTNTKIWDDYKKIGLEEILRKYLKQENEDYFLQKKISNIEVNDIKRILFNNSFVISFDDVLGRYYFRRFNKR